MTIFSSILRKRFRIFCCFCIIILGCILNIAYFMYESPDVFPFPELLNNRDWDYHRSQNTIIDNLNVSCESVFAGSTTSVDLNITYLEDRISNSNDRCALYRSSFGFKKNDASKEEKDFPLAYAILAHNRFVQFVLMLSSFYESHNVFCISVPSNADAKFAREMHGLADCFENIHPVGKVTWGSYEIIRATYDCMKYLIEEQPYLSGVDVPLRTNLEMVRVLKEWNGISHTNVEPLELERLQSANPKDISLRMFKSSLSAIIARNAAQMMIVHSKTNELLTFLKDTKLADESFWSTVLGNPDVISIPGSFNASEFLELAEQHKKVQPSSNCSHFPCHTRGFVGRHQLWKKHCCYGLWINSSCVFGIRDLPFLIASPAFVAHKFYIEHEPAGLICMLKEVNGRRAHPDNQFDPTLYNHLPQIEFARWGSLANLTRRDLLYTASRP